MRVARAMLLISGGVQASQVLRCAERGTVLMAGECHLPLSQGPCPPGQIILASEEGTGSCSTWPCREDEVFIKSFMKTFFKEVFRWSGAMGRWNSVLNLMHLFAQERGRDCGQSLMEDGSAAAKRVGVERGAWEDADS